MLCIVNSTRTVLKGLYTQEKLGMVGISVGINRKSLEGLPIKSLKDRDLKRLFSEGCDCNVKTVAF